MKVAFFGGSFDPPHLCHVTVVGLGLSTGEVDKVLVVPCHQHAFGKPLADFQHRLNMACQAFAIFGNKVEVTAVEQEIGGESRTLRTLRHLASKHPDWSLRLLVGGDIPGEKDQWHRFDDVVDLAPLLVVGRQGHGTPGPALALPDVSSSEIRGLVARGKDVSHLVPSSVVGYIRANRLYSTAAKNSGIPRGPKDVNPATDSILVVGAGKVGTNLARLFSSRGVQTTLWNKWPLPESQRHTLCQSTPDLRVAQEQAPQIEPPSLVLLSVSDDAIEQAAELAEGWGIPPETPFLHTSGIREPCFACASGRPTGGMHPAFSFPAFDLSLDTLAGMCFLLDGHETAVAAAKGLLERCGLGAVRAPGTTRTLYHGGCVTASNFLGVLGVAAQRLFMAAGVRRETDRSALLLSLLYSVLDNGARAGFANALTGPVARGDVDTVLAEARQIARSTPELLDLFIQGNRTLAQLTNQPEVDYQLQQWLEELTQQ